MNAPVIRYPVNAADVFHAEIARQDLPLDVAALLKAAEAQAYTRGHHDALREVTLHPELLDHLGDDCRRRAAADRADRLEQKRHAEEQRAATARAERNVAAGRHPGWEYTGQTRGGSGAVCWDTGYPIETVNAWLARPRAVPTPAVPAYRPAPPARGEPALTSWEQVHAGCTPSVWLRIWGDLSDRTRRSIGHLDPAGRRPLRVVGGREAA